MSDDLEKAYYINQEHAKNARHKFNYYFVGLTFSLLTLAINHGFETDLVAPKIVGLVGWFILLISGFAGLSLIAEEGSFFSKKADIIKFQAWKKDADDDYKKNLDKMIKDGEQLLDKEESKSIRIYIVQKWCFFFGMLFLVISYAYPIICTIYQNFTQ